MSRAERYADKRGKVRDSLKLIAPYEIPKTCHSEKTSKLTSGVRFYLTLATHGSIKIRQR